MLHKIYRINTLNSAAIEQVAAVLFELYSLLVDRNQMVCTSYMLGHYCMADWKSLSNREE